MSACNTAPRKEVFRDDTPRMATIYRQAVQRSAYTANTPMLSPSLTGVVESGEVSAYTRNSANEIDNLFPELPNPTLLMYVFPHITADDIRVPGFTTAFKMYRRQHYALPGETP